MSKLSRAIRFIMAIWIVAFCLAIPQACQFGVVVNIYGGSACTVNYPEPKTRPTRARSADVVFSRVVLRMCVCERERVFRVYSNI